MSTRSGTFNPRVRRSVPRAIVNRLERKIVALEGKELLTEKDQQSVPKTRKKLEDAAADYRTYHFAVIDQIEEEERFLKQPWTGLKKK